MFDTADERGESPFPQTWRSTLFMLPFIAFDAISASVKRWSKAMNAITQISQTSSSPIAIAAARPDEEHLRFDLIELCRTSGDFVPVVSNGQVWGAAADRLETLRPTAETITAADYVEGLEVLGFAFEVLTREDGTEYLARIEPEAPLPEAWDRRAVDLTVAFRPRDTDTEVVDFFRSRQNGANGARPQPSIFDLESRHRSIYARYEAAAKAHSAAEARYFAASPKLPADVLPDDLIERFKAMTIAELSDRSHPVNIERAAHYAAREAQRQAYEAELARLEQEHGVDETERRMYALLDEADAIVEQIAATRAETPAGMLLKLNVADGVLEDGDILDELRADLEAAVARDARLLELGQCLDEAWARERETCNAIKAHGHDNPCDELEAAFDTAYKVCGGVVDEIMAMPASTLEGLKVKARAVSWCHSGEEVILGDQNTTDMRLVASILRDLGCSSRATETSSDGAD